MNSCDFRVFLQEFGTTVHLSLPGSVSEKERLLLKLLMQGMSVTEISQYRNRSAKTISLDCPPESPDNQYHLNK